MAVLGAHLGGLGLGDLLKSIKSNEIENEIKSSDGRIGARWGGSAAIRIGGWCCGTRLDRQDLRLQREEVRVVREALLAIVLATAVCAHHCRELLRAVSVQAVAGGPISTAGQDAPVELPPGVALEELLGPAGVRNHADEPVAAPDDPNVSPFFGMGADDIKNWIHEATGARPKGNPSHATLVAQADAVNVEIKAKRDAVAA